jgi:cold shock CspA family protein
MSMQRGTITRLVRDKRLGYVRTQDARTYYFHGNSCDTPFDDLREGQTVTFEPGRDALRGPQAQRVQALS